MKQFKPVAHDNGVFVSMVEWQEHLKKTASKGLPEDFDANEQIATGRTLAGLVKERQAWLYRGPALEGHGADATPLPKEEFGGSPGALRAASSMQGLVPIEMHPDGPVAGTKVWTLAKGVRLASGHEFHWQYQPNGMAELLESALEDGWLVAKVFADALQAMGTQRAQRVRIAPQKDGSVKTMFKVPPRGEVWDALLFPDGRPYHVVMHTVATLQNVEIGRGRPVPGR